MCLVGPPVSLTGKEMYPDDGIGEAGREDSHRCMLEDPLVRRTFAYLLLCVCVCV